nr:hypothetical protein [Fervidobacterium pennivorans]
MKLIDKLGNIIYTPIELLTDLAKEPLKRWEHKRSIERIDAEAQARIKEKNAEVDLIIKKERTLAEIEEFKKDKELEREKARIDAEAQARAQARIKEKNAEVDLMIKKERALAEIEEFKKDKELERMKAVSEAIMKYQDQLTRLNVNAINAIGHMQLDLRERAQQLVCEKSIIYIKMQKKAFEEAENDLKRIEKDFHENDRAREILMNAVGKRLVNIIDTATKFLIELNEDIKKLNHSISLLAEQGQIFIEHHLKKFHVIEGDTIDIKKLEGGKDIKDFST